MTKLPTPEDNGRRILEIYKHFNSTPGRVLGVNNFLAVGLRRRWESSELQQGLEFARDNGWIREKNQGFELTERGFQNM